MRKASGTPAAASAVPADDAAGAARKAVDALYANDLAAQALGIEVQSVAPGHVRVSMRVRPDMLNGHRTCHGGIIFALADTAFAFACNSYGDAMVAAGAFPRPLRAAARTIQRFVNAGIQKHE